MGLTGEKCAPNQARHSAGLHHSWGPPVDTYTDRIHAEQDAVQAGTAVACGHTGTGDYDTLVCIRKQHDPTAGHVADVGGQLVQWLESDGGQ